VKRKAQPKPGQIRPTRSHLAHDHIVDRTTRLADAMVRISSRHMKERWKLRHTDLRLLNVLDGEEPITVLEISRRGRNNSATQPGELLPHFSHVQRRRRILHDFPQ